MTKTSYRAEIDEHVITADSRSIRQHTIHVTASSTRGARNAVHRIAAQRDMGPTEIVSLFIEESHS